MKIVFDLTPLYDHLSGIERFSMNIALGFIRQHLNEEYILLFKEEIHDSFLSLKGRCKVKYYIIKKCHKLYFQQIRLFKVLNKIDADFYVFLGFVSPVLFRRQGLINTIHDLTCWDCPETIPLKMRYYYRLSYRNAIKHSFRVITVSKFSQNRICEKYSVQKDFVWIIKDGLSDLFRKRDTIEKDVFKRFNLPNRYWLSLSTIEPRKNIQLLLRAYNDLIEQGIELPVLVLAGRKGWKLEKITDHMSKKMRAKVLFIGFVEDEYLPALYNCAEIFIFPSKYEGFGLPVLEAMSQGTAVLTSDVPSLTEIVQGEGYCFRNDDIIDLKEKMLSLLEKNKEKLKSPNAERVCEQYTWDGPSNELYDLIIDSYKI